MSWIATAGYIIAAAGAAYSAYSSVQQGNYAKDQANADAEAMKGQARLEAERIQKQKEETRSAARAAAAESGLSVSDGLAVTIDEQISQDANMDAWMTRLNGQSNANRMSVFGSNEKKVNNAAAIGTVLQTAGSIASMKGSSAKAKKG